MCQSHACLTPVGFLIGEDLVARHNPPFDFIEDHEPAKLHEGSPFVPRDDTGMRLMQAEDFLSGFNLLAFQHPSLCLLDHTRNQRQDLLS